MNKKQKKVLYRILLSLGFMIGIIIVTSYVSLNLYVEVILYLIPYVIIGYDILRKAIKGILKRQVFDENFLMAVATVGAMCLGEFREGVAVMLFYQVGELFQSYAVDKSRKSIASLMDIRPDYANIEKDRKVLKVDPDDVNIGDIIIIKPGEKVPLDGIVIEGNTSLDTKALTGESLPREASPGDEILSGSINISGLIKVKVSKEYGESTVSKILDLVENASSKKSKSENFITKFAQYYTPIVVIIAVLLVVVPVIFFGGEFSDWIYRALSFLVVSCPCALVISIPLSFFGGIGGASKMGILIKGSNYLEAIANTEIIVFDKIIKGSNYLEAIANTEIIVFDKTGTLTEGTFEVQKVNAKEIDENDLVEIAAYAECYSNHPISLSIKRAYGKQIDKSKIKSTEELSGRGIVAIINEKTVLVGNEKLLNENNIEFEKNNDIGTILYVAIDKKYVGNIVIADKIKEDAKDSIMSLKKSNIKQAVMLTGDRKAVGENVAGILGIDKVYTELLPDGKVEKVEELLKKKSEKGKLAFVGDGINDAPVLALADIGIAMGGLGADSAIEAADIVLMTDEPSKIVDTIKLSKKTMKIVKENIIFAISIKVLVLILSAIGISTMWEAVFADVGVSIIAILNALRVLNVKKMK